MSQAYYPSPTSQDQRPTRTVNANGLRVECFFNADGKLEEKIVHYSDRVQSRYHYRFDDAGHLTQVFLGGREMERYSYNERGQRVSRLSFNGASSAYPETMSYNDAGRLTGAGLTLFSYNPDGSLRERRHVTFNTITRYSYGDNTMLDKVELPNRQKIRYEYHKERPLLPFRRFKNDELTMEYFWHDSMLLRFCMDHETQLQYLFSYTEQGVLEDIYLKPFTEDDPRKQYGVPCIIHVGCDQVGTPILFRFEDGRPCKLLQYDSFGNCIFDGKPNVFIPVGFAGGLVDKDTGLVRFGWRDYDPTVGRFTALDPARDRRGDGDLYDYCMDDPVTFVDPTGLWTQATFDESRVNRDEEGQFGSGGGGGSDGALTTAVNIGDAAVQAASQQQAVQFAAQTAQLAATAGDQIIPAQEAALQQQTVQLKENLGPPAASAARQVRHDTLLTRSNSEEPWDTTTPEEARSVKAALDHISPDKGDLRLNGEHDRNYQPVTLP